MNIKKITAFSLIELMVVIAVVGVLATIAAPAYQNYIFRARLASTVPVINDLVQRSIEYASINGRFGDAYDLGLSDGIGIGGTHSVDNPSVLSPYFANPMPGNSFIIADTGVGSCGETGVVWGYFNAAAFGLPPSADQFLIDLYGNTSWGLFQCDFWHYEGVINKDCWYSYYDPNDPTGTNYGTENLIPGWHNACIDSICNDLNPEIASFIDTSTYYQATCQ